LFGQPVEDGRRFKLTVVPAKLSDGDTIRFTSECKPTMTRLRLTYHTWDDQELMFGVEVPILAPMEEILRKCRNR
jgi:hypothetical protein